MMTSNIQYQRMRLHSKDVLINKYKTFPMKLYGVTEISLIEGQVLFFKNDEQLLIKVRLNKAYTDINKAIEENKIILI